MAKIFNFWVIEVAHLHLKIKVTGDWGKGRRSSGLGGNPQGWGVICLHFMEYSTGNKKEENSEYVMLSVMIYKKNIQ